MIKQCDNCSGTGFIHLDVDMLDVCSSCGGTGTIERNFRCERCEDKGFIFICLMSNNATNKVAKMCPVCNDIKKYSDYIKTVLKNCKDIDNSQGCLKPISTIPYSNNVIYADFSKNRLNSNDKEYTDNIIQIDFNKKTKI